MPKTSHVVQHEKQKTAANISNRSCRCCLRLKDKKESLEFMSETLLIGSDAGPFLYFKIRKRKRRIIPFCSQALKCMIADPNQLQRQKACRCFHLALILGYPITIFKQIHEHIEVKVEEVSKCK